MQTGVGRARRREGITPRRHRAIGRLILAVAFLLLPAITHASRMRPVNLEEMVRLSGRIVQGRCVEVRVEQDARAGAVTVVTLQVDRTVKGKADRKIEIRLTGGLGPGGRPEVVGMPRFLVGEEVILFLHRESRLGLTSPVGLGQGKFVLRPDGRGGRAAVNEFGNRALFRGLSGEGRRLVEGVAREAGPARGMPADVLLRMAERLAARPDTPPGAVR